MKKPSRFFMLFVFFMAIPGLACQRVAALVENDRPDTESTSAPAGDNDESEFRSELDQLWQDGELTVYTDSDWNLAESEPTPDQLLSGLAGLDRIDLGSPELELHAIYAAYYDSAYANVFAPIQFLVASGHGLVITESTFTLNNRLMAFWEVQQGEKTGLMYAIQLESGEAVSLITWVSTTSLENYREGVAAMAASVDTNRAVAAREAGPPIPQPENTHLAYAQQVRSSLAGEVVQAWTWDGKAGDVVRVTVGDGSAPIQLTVVDPAGANMAYTPTNTPFDSDPIALPSDGRYGLRLKTNPGLTTNYSLQINLVEKSEVPLGQQTEIPYNPESPYFIFWGEAGRFVTIEGTADTRPVGLVLYATSFAQWRHGSVGQVRGRLPYSGPYLVRLYDVPDGSQSLSVLVSQGEAEDLDQLVAAGDLLDASLELDFPVTAELIPGAKFPGLSASDCERPCTFLFVGQAGQEISIIASHKTYGDRSPTIILYMPTGGEWLRLPVTSSEDYEADFTLGPIILPMAGIYRVEIHESRYITLIVNE